MVVKLGDGTRMTVLVPNADARRAGTCRRPGKGRLSWSDENIHIVREGGEHEPATSEGDEA